jgi:intracellular sulfur oxidation DsrE/DsrF family protein
MKYFFLASLLFFSVIVCGQQKPHKIIYDINAADTAAQSTIFRQFNNILTVAPDAQIEVVYHGQAITGLVKDKSYFAEKIKMAQQKGVIFAACNNSLKRVKIDPSMVLPGVIVVPVAILELSAKQQDGWSYIKAGE